MASWELYIKFGVIASLYSYNFIYLIPTAVIMSFSARGKAIVQENIVFGRQRDISLRRLQTKKLKEHQYLTRIQQVS